MKLEQATKLLILIILLTSLISIYFLFVQSIRLDEAQSIWMFTKSVPGMLKLTSQDVNLPLYGLIMHFWLQIFGVDIIRARLLSLLFFLLTLPILYKLIKESSNSDYAILTVALFSFSPFIIWYTSEARTYTLFTLITCLQQLYFLRLVRSNGENGKFGFFISTVLGFYTHYFFIFLLITQLVYGISLRILKGKDFNKLLKRQIGLLILGGLFFSPWIYYVIRLGLAANTQPVIPPPNSYNVVQTFVNFTVGFQPQNIQSILISMWPLSTIILFLMFTHKKQKLVKNIEYYFLVSFLPIILVFIISFIRPIFLSRYLILTTPTLFFIIAWIILNNTKKVSFYLSILLLSIMFGFTMSQNISASTPAKENYGTTSQYLNQYTTPTDIVAITAPFTIYPIEYQYSGRAKLVTIPNWDRYIEGPIPEFDKQKLVEQIESYKTQYNRLFVVFSYDQGYESEIKSYLDTHYAIMGMGNFSDTIEMRIYKLRY